jgi:hypothetical protein
MAPIATTQPRELKHRMSRRGQKASNAPPLGKRAVAFPRRVRVHHRLHINARGAYPRTGPPHAPALVREHNLQSLS